MQQTIQNQSGYVKPIQVQKYLQGTDYPATKDELLDLADAHGADEKVKKTLQAMPGDEFNSPNDVSQAIKKIK